MFGAAGRGVNHFGVAAGKRLILLITNEKDRKRARGNGFDRGDFRDGKTGEFFSTIEQGPTEGRENRFTEPGIFSESGVVVGSFAKIGERGFGDDGFDAGIGRGGLQSDARAHGFAEHKDVERTRGRPRHPRYVQRLAHLDIDVGRKLVPNESVDDSAGIVAFEPAVGGDGTFAGAVGAGVHHDDAIAGEEEDAGVSEDAHAIVGDAVEEDDPVVGIRPAADFPAMKHHAIGGADVEVFAVCADLLEGGVGLLDKVRRKLAADGMDETGSDQPSGHGGEERREEEQDQSDADHSL